MDKKTFNFGDEMKKQYIDFELDNELSNEAVDKIFDILQDAGAVNIVHDFKKE